MAGSAPRTPKPDRSAKKNLMITKCSLEQVFPLSSALLSADSLRSPLQLQFQLKAEVQRGIEPSVRCLSSLLEFDGHLGSEFFPLTDHRDFFKTPRRQNRSEWARDTSPLGSSSSFRSAIEKLTQRENEVTATNEKPNSVQILWFMGGARRPWQGG